MNTGLFSLIIVLAAFTTGFQAQASDAFQTEISLSAKELGADMKAHNLCYQLASQGEVVGEERVPTGWHESLLHSEYVYRITRLSSGLTCRELVRGTNELQFGAAARKEGCNCQGTITILK